MSNRTVRTLLVNRAGFVVEMHEHRACRVPKRISVIVRPLYTFGLNELDLDVVRAINLGIESSISEPLRRMCFRWRSVRRNFELPKVESPLQVIIFHREILFQTVTLFVV
jgi:hypothetical protein